MMRHLAIAFVLLCVSASPLHAQSQPRSQWGVAGGFVPTFSNTKSFEPLTELVFDEGVVDLLQGSEFRIGIARGRLLSGDWGVSFIRKRIDTQDPTIAEEGRGCGGGFTTGQPVVLDCEVFFAERTPDSLQISGVEVHKYVPFVTIKQRVQIGLNFAGGVGVGQGGYRSRTFTSRFTCTFPPGTELNFDQEDVCEGSTRGPETITTTGEGDEPFEQLLNYERNRIPLGKIEIAGTVILTPQLKVRIGGGLNYPGRTNFGVTGIYFFGRN